MKIKPNSSQIYVGRPLMGLKLKPIEIIIEENKTHQNQRIKTISSNKKESTENALF